MDKHAVLFSTLEEKSHERKVTFVIQKQHKDRWIDSINFLGDVEEFKSFEFAQKVKKFKEKSQPDISYRIVRTETLTSRYKQVVD